MNSMAQPADQRASLARGTVRKPHQDMGQAGGADHQGQGEQDHVDHLGRGPSCPV